MMNISEFERNKPRITYKKLNDLIQGYEIYVKEMDVVMDAEDAATNTHTLYL